MAQVHRFTLPWAVAAGHDVFIQGLGLFTSGTFDVALANTALITALQAASGVTDGGVVDNAVSPAPGATGNNDPFPQYLTAAELTTSIQGGSDSVAQALKAAFVAGSVYNSDGSKSTTKTLHVVLTADGTDIQDLIIQ